MKRELKIRQYRIQRKWKLSCVAQMTGTNYSTIQKIETGSRKPSYELLMKLENLYGIPYRELLKETDECMYHDTPIIAQPTSKSKKKLKGANNNESKV